jgi:hypothetical protein
MPRVGEGDAMTQPWEADFIRLWQAGATQADIAPPTPTTRPRGTPSPLSLPY